MPRSLENTFIHIYTSSPHCNCLYSCNIPLKVSITALSSKWIHDSCTARIYVDRVYLEAVLSVLGCCRIWDLRVSTGAVIDKISDGTVMGPGNGNLSCGDKVGDIVGRYFASIFYRVLMACICSSTTKNVDAGAGLLSASIKSSTAWRMESVEDTFGISNL